jgi:hypothetical protein
MRTVYPSGAREPHEEKESGREGETETEAKMGSHSAWNPKLLLNETMLWVGRWSKR